MASSQIGASHLLLELVERANESILSVCQQSICRDHKAFRDENQSRTGSTPCQENFLVL